MTMGVGLLYILSTCLFAMTITLYTTSDQMDIQIALLSVGSVIFPGFTILSNKGLNQYMTQYVKSFKLKVKKLPILFGSSAVVYPVIE